MSTDEMTAFVLTMFRKERQIWRTWLLSNDSELARGALARVEAAECAFREAMGLD